MNYEEFKNYAKSNIKPYLQPEYQNRNVSIQRVPKTNGFREALIIHDDVVNEPIPNIYLDEFFTHYQNGVRVEALLQDMADQYHYGIEYGKSMLPFMMRKPENDTIVCTLVNTKNNLELLSKVPHRDFLDLSVVYRFCLTLPDRSMNMAIITNEIAEDLDLSEEELYELSLENAQRLLPDNVETIGDCLTVHTNTYGIMGASVMLYGESIRQEAEESEKDLLIIPSSVHEVITIPVGTVEADNLMSIVGEANKSLLEPDEILSETLYYYCRDADCIVCARNMKCS